MLLLISKLSEQLASTRNLSQFSPTFNGSPRLLCGAGVGRTRDQRHRAGREQPLRQQEETEQPTGEPRCAVRVVGAAWERWVRSGRRSGVLRVLMVLNIVRIPVARHKKTQGWTPTPARHGKTPADFIASGRPAASCQVARARAARPRAPSRRCRLWRPAGRPGHRPPHRGCQACYTDHSRCSDFCEATTQMMEALRTQHTSNAQTYTKKYSLLTHPCLHQRLGRRYQHTIAMTVAITRAPPASAAPRRARAR